MCKYHLHVSVNVTVGTKLFSCSDVAVLSLEMISEEYLEPCGFILLVCWGKGSVLCILFQPHPAKSDSHFEDLLQVLWGGCGFRHFSGREAQRRPWIDKWEELCRPRWTSRCSALFHWTAMDFTYSNLQRTSAQMLLTPEIFKLYDQIWKTSCPQVKPNVCMISDRSEDTKQTRSWVKLVKESAWNIVLMKWILSGLKQAKYNLYLWVEF